VKTMNKEEILKTTGRESNKVTEWAVEISWNDGVTCFVRDTELHTSTQEQVNKNINSIWQDAIDDEITINVRRRGKQ